MSNLSKNLGGQFDRFSQKNHQNLEILSINRNSQFRK